MEAAGLAEAIEFGQTNLNNLHVGSKLLVQTKKDWRTAVVSCKSGENIILRICSPSGGTYRKKCEIETVLTFDGVFHLLGEGVWREQFVKYDCRW